MNSLFHGLGLMPLLTSAPYSWGGFGRVKPRH
jgi:hypothetical protein